MLVGACFGGWIAAEMMVRSTTRFSNLVLVDPLGIKISGREERDIADMHGLPRAEYLRLAWADPAKGEVDFTNLPESELAAIVRGREAFALYGWKPYMHNPRLKRWLHRIDIPTLLLWGAEDRIVTPAYGEGWRQAIPGARLEPHLHENRARRRAKRPSLPEMPPVKRDQPLPVALGGRLVVTPTL